MNVDLTSVFCCDEVYGSGDKWVTSIARKPRQHTVADNPRGDVRVWGATILALRLADPIEYQEDVVAVIDRQEETQAAHQVIHMQGHEEGA